MGVLKYIISAFLVFVSINVTAATYYIDYTGGADTNNGTSTSTPFKHCPGDDNATSTSLATTLSGGDTIVFKGGVVYQGRVDLDWSGSAGSVITYDGNSAGTWGTGKAILGDIYDLYVTSSIYPGFYGSNKNYITINNFVLRNIGGVSSYSSYSCDGCIADHSSLSSCTDLPPDRPGRAMYIANSTYIVISNNDFQQIGHWDITKPLSSSLITGAGIYLINGNHITIDANTFTKMSTAIYNLIGTSGGTGTASSIEIKNNTIGSYLRWGIGLFASYSGAVVQDIDIHNNVIHDFTDYDPINWNSLTVGNCGVINAIHTDMMIIGTANSTVLNVTWGTPTHPNKVYNNHFYQNKAEVCNRTSPPCGGTAAIYLTGAGGTWYIYQNLFNNTLMQNADIRVQDGPTSGSTLNDFHIYNNVFFDAYWQAIMLNSHTGYELNGSGKVVDIRNNIFYSINTGSKLNISVVDSLSSPSTLDYNTYKTSRADGLIANVNGTSYTSSTLSVIGFENHGVSGNPNFIDISNGFGENSSLNNFSITANSTNVVNRGYDLSTYFTTDYVGENRPTGVGTWDIGAYELTGNDSTPPTVTSAIIQSSGTSIVISFSEAVNASSGSAFTITPSGGSATLTCPAVSSAVTMSCAISRTVEQGENATFGYTGTTVEDLLENDLGTISNSPSCINNSTQQSPPVYTLSVSKGDGVYSVYSWASGITCGSDCDHEYDSGTVVGLYGDCYQGWQNFSIFGDNCSTTVTMDGDRTCTTSCTPIRVMPWVR